MTVGVFDGMAAVGSTVGNAVSEGVEVLARYSAVASRVGNSAGVGGGNISEQPAALKHPTKSIIAAQIFAM